MISLSHLNKLTFSVIFLITLTFNPVLAEDEPADIWEEQVDQKEQDNENNNEKNITIISPILSDSVDKIIIKIDESKIEDQKQSVIGIFDPEDNNHKEQLFKLKLKMFEQDVVKNSKARTKKTALRTAKTPLETIEVYKSFIN